jgi:hypothetical protein
MDQTQILQESTEVSPDKEEADIADEVDKLDSPTPISISSTPMKDT